MPGDSAAGVHARDDGPPKNITEDFRSKVRRKVPDAFEADRLMCAAVGRYLETLNDVGVNLP